MSVLTADYLTKGIDNSHVYKMLISPTARLNHSFPDPFGLSHFHVELLLLTSRISQNACVASREDLLMPAGDSALHNPSSDICNLRAAWWTGKPSIRSPIQAALLRSQRTHETQILVLYSTPNDLTHLGSTTRKQHGT